MFLMKMLYLFLIIISLTILNWGWVQEIGMIDKRKVYLYDYTQIENKPLDVKIIFFTSWSILSITVFLFYIRNDFRYYDIILGYIIYKFIPYISAPINIP
tara:strand:- start:891 stop:1190 length:300 start_codon:yes stop_codon:yes gene_type:complete